MSAAIDPMLDAFREQRWSGHRPTTPAALGFGATLRRLREARRVSQSELARRAGCAFSYVSRLERGERTPSRDAVERLAGALGLDFDPADRVALYLAAGYVEGDRPAWAASPIVERLGRALLAADHEEAERLAWAVGRLLGEPG